MISPPSLIEGDKIGIVAPARKISREEIEPSLKIIKDYGFVPVLGKHLFDEENQFSGADTVRAADIQEMLDDDSIKAVFSARGGYGSVRIIDRIDFSHFAEKPKWLVGYSDFTVFLNHVSKNLGIKTLHASMPVNFKDNTVDALNNLFKILKGEYYNVVWDTVKLSRPGKAEGVVVGGNLSVLYGMLCSNSFPDTRGKILFIEDLDEYLYHIDRMMTGLKRAGVLKNLSGLIVGAMTDMHDNSIGFGKDAEEIIFDSVDEYGFPVAFGYPAGHIPGNNPVIVGSQATLTVGNISEMSYK